MKIFYLLYFLIIAASCTVKSEKMLHYKSENFNNDKDNFPYSTREDELNLKRLNNRLVNNFIRETNSNHIDDAEERTDDMYPISGRGKSSILIIDIIDKIPANKPANFNSNKNLINDNNSSNLLKRVLNHIRNSSEESDDSTTKSSFSQERNTFERIPLYSVNQSSSEETDEGIMKSYSQQKNSTARVAPTVLTNRKTYEETVENKMKSFSSHQKNSTVRMPTHSSTVGHSNEEAGESLTRPYSQPKNSTTKISQPSVISRKPNEKTDEKISKPYSSTARIPPPSLMDSATGKSTLRVCEIKYAEYIQRIFPQETDTASDANDEEFNGRVLAAPGEYPHMAALGFRSSDGKFDYKCGGSLISESFVITAAHCTNFTGLEPTRVRIGDLNLMVEESYLEPQIRDIKNIYVHPEYKTTSYYNDIALLELQTEVRLTEFVRPIRLWTQETLPFTTAYSMGYGSTEFAREQTNRLTNLNMTIVPNDECNREMPKLPQTERGILRSQICARDYALNRDTCQGDSGGPLQLNIRGRRSQNRLHYQLIGITSYGLHCRSGYPSIFTRVCFYLDWIERIVWKDYFN